MAKESVAPKKSATPIVPKKAAPKKLAAEKPVFATKKQDGRFFVNGRQNIICKGDQIMSITIDVHNKVARVEVNVYTDAKDADFLFVDGITEMPFSFGLESLKNLVIKEFGQFIEK